MSIDQQKIVPVEMEREFKNAYLQYAMAVIVSRALPDVRDGLKPVHRRILFNMYEAGLTPDKGYRKSAATVGDVLGKYHPHGDASVYDALVRMAQDFSLRYPLIDGQGNFGSVDGDPPAAYRYTEARMAKIAVEMLTDIEKDTVEFQPNYDGRQKEPTVLPSKFPNLLVNGSVGIAVGMATNIPPQNLTEIIDAALALLENPEVGLDVLMGYVKGPDFPTAGIIMGRSGIRAAYATGKGHIKVRARTEIEEHGNGRFRIAVTELPYMVNKARLLENIAEMVKDKRIEGISDLRDESDSEGMRMVIELKKEANPQVVLNQLFNYTQLQDTFAVNMLALVDGQPKVLTLKEMLLHYLHHQQNIVVARTKYDLRKAAERAHLLAGFRIAVDNIDEVIRIIRASATVNDAKAALIERFKDVEIADLLERAGEDLEANLPDHGLTEVQATAIVNMRLGQLTGLAVEDIEKEYKEKMADIAKFREILTSTTLINNIVRDELLAIKKKYGDARRTQIESIDDDIDIEDLIKEEDCVYTLTRMGYIKRIPVGSYKSQRRGGRGITAITTRDEDIVDTLFVCSTHDYILCFTTSGRLYRIKGYQIPEAGRTAKGMNMVNLLQLEPDEKVTAMLHTREFPEDRYLVMVTSGGMVKRMTLASLESSRKAGIKAITLQEGEWLMSVVPTDGKMDVLIASKQGKAVCFSENDVRCMGREAGGVWGIRLAEDDAVVGALCVESGGLVVSITENGYGKCTEEAEFTRHSRGGKGMVLHRLTDKTGNVAGVLSAGEDNDIMMITDDGTMIRTAIKDIRICGRASQGVIVMRPSGNEKVISVALTDSLIEEEKTTEDEEEAFEEGETDGGQTAEEPDGE